ncbi:hypothetical protein OROMI_026480 [Orobanche minor]
MEVATTDPVLLRCPNPKCEMRFGNDTMLQRHLAEQMRKKKKEKMKKKKKEKKRKKKQVFQQSKVEPSHGGVSCFCGRVLDSLEALGNHLSTHGEQDLATTHNLGVPAHLRVVKNKSFACDLCTKKFETQEGVQAHKAAKGNHSRSKQQVEELNSSKGMEHEDEKEAEMTNVDPSDSKSFTSINLLDIYFVRVKDAEIEDEREDAEAVYTNTPFCTMCDKMDHTLSQCPWQMKIPDGERLRSSEYNFCCIGCGMLGKECCKKGIRAVRKTCGLYWLGGHWSEACPYYKPKA